MPRKTEKVSPKKEIGRLLLIFGSAALVAVLAIGLLVWRATGGGHYLGRNVILAPDILTGAASLGDVDPESRLQRSWVFSRVDYYDQQRRHYGVDPEAYAAFYEKISDSKSLRRGEELACHFEGKVSTLVLTLDPTGRYSAAYSPRQFLQIEFAPDGELFRVQVQKGWAYFQAPGIGHDAQSLFVRRR